MNIIDLPAYLALSNHVMLNKSRSYYILSLLLLWGIMSSNSCQSCKNASTKGPRSNRYKLKDETPDQHDDQYDDQSTKKRLLDPQTKLMNAVAKGQVDTSTLIQLLEQRTIDPTAKDEKGRSVIQHIIYNGTTPDGLRTFLQQLKQQFPEEVADQEIAKILNTPDNLPRPNTAFVGAVETMGEKRNQEPIELVDILFENGAIPSREEWKRSLLYCIRLSGLETSETNSGTELFKHLAQKFQEKETVPDQATLLAVASAAALTGNDELMQYILEQADIFPVDAASKDEKGNTLLHYAAKGGRNSERVISLLLEKFKSFGSKDEKGNTLDYLNQVNDQGETALHIAVKEGLYKNVCALLKAEAKVNLQDQNGKTPLDIANDLIKQQPTDNTLLAIRKILQSAAARSEAIN